MCNRSLRRQILFAAYYCALALVMSMISWNSIAVAQNTKLNTLLEKLGDGAKSGVPRRPSGRLKNVGADGLRNDQEEDEIFPSLELTLEERIVANRYCTGKIAADDYLLILLDKKFSRLERDYCRRVNGEIFQFGYNIFSNQVDEQLIGGGAIQENYVLGEGDELLINFYGREAASEVFIVDSLGRLLIQDFPPVTVVGMTFGEFSRWLKASVKEKKIGTEVYLSLNSVRSIMVTVAGEIEKPGRHQLTSLSSVLDALTKAGGIKKTGSLRRIRIVRGDKIFWLDLYDLLHSTGFSQDLALRDGDTVIVPLIGQTFAVNGFVHRPAIYELAEGEKSISVSAALEIAGGSVRPRGVFVRHITFDEHGQEKTVEKAVSAGTVHGGDIVTLQRSENIQLQTVELLGHVRVPGKRSLSAAATVRDLVRSKDNLKDNPYLLFAVLETTDPSTRARRNFPINLRRVLSNEENFALRDGDRLIIFGAKDIDFLNSRDVQDLLRADLSVAKGRQAAKSSEGGLSGAIAAGLASTEKKKTQLLSSNSQLARNIVQVLLDQKIISNAAGTGSKIEEAIASSEKTGCLGLRNLSAIVKLAGNSRFRNAFQAQASASRENVEDFQVCPRIFNSKPDLLPFLLEFAVSANGEVRYPGAYPITNSTSLSSLVAVAGGLTRDISLSQLEISRLQSGANVRETVDLSKRAMNTINLNPGDVARFNAVFSDRETGPVRLLGEFLRPGLYDIRRGERLSEIIVRAGGLTKQAYPYGSIFTRESVKVAQKIAFRRTARELRSSAVYAGGKAAANPQALSALNDLTQRLENVEPLGRVVMEADPTVLQVRPEFDTVLEAGDQIYIPKRPNSVLIIGDVLNPGALQFVSGAKVDQYVNQAGGLQQSADEDRIFLVYPNGIAQPITVSVWNYNPVQVPPGSTIVVPKDPAPLDIFAFAKDITSLVSQLAITAASLAVISGN